MPQNINILLFPIFNINKLRFATIAICCITIAKNAVHKTIGSLQQTMYAMHQAMKAVHKTIYSLHQTIDAVHITLKAVHKT